MKGSFDVEGTLDPGSITPSEQEATGPQAAEGVATGRSAQGVVMSENDDDCGASFITIHQTPGRFAPAWGVHGEKDKRKNEIRISQATRTGTDVEGIDDEWPD